LQQCLVAAERADQRRVALEALPAHVSFNNKIVESQEILDVSAFGTLPVVDIGSLVIRRNWSLQIKASPATQAVLVRVNGRLVIGQNGKILTAGFLPGPRGAAAERVLFLVDGKVNLGAFAEVEGTIIAAESIRTRRFSRVKGALISTSGDVRLGRYAWLEHFPWVFW
ncbi:MAG: ice-binding family protein, partial [Candidatus Sumerlaeaceae bacterium]|nr:ice-binding family protein [Candidatus Sumerlaeaceae bacterium]